MQVLITCRFPFRTATQVSADHIAGYKGASARKHAIAKEVVSLGLPLTVNMVVHRANIARIESTVKLALSLGAGRVEIAHVQYYGWALKNRAALMPTREQVDIAVRQVEMLRTQASWPDRHRCGGAGLLCALSEAMRRRMGPPLA